jgi:DNA replication and repair protein RecF
VQVRSLELVGFRNYPSLAFAPDPGVNVLAGPNGHGKTSLLEALHVLVEGRSFRTPRLGECIGWGAPAATVAGELVRGGEGRAVRLGLVPRGSGIGLRGVVCPWGRAVSFMTMDVMLVAGMPPLRRAYLDGAAAKLVPAHAEVCRRYRLVLQQRARLLGHLAGRPEAERCLAPWDEQTATLGAEIVHRRLETLAVLAPEACGLWSRLSPKGEALALTYVPVVPPGSDRAEGRQALLAALGAGRGAELRRGMTLVGPHRDDLAIRVGRGDARSGVSRGEQRLLALVLRLAEAGGVRDRLGLAPVFLLDDLLAEFDGEVRERVVDWLSGQGQVLFTATDVGGLGGGVDAVWEVRDATVSEVPSRSARGAA